MTKELTIETGAPGNTDIAARVNKRRNMKLDAVLHAMGERITGTIELYKEMAADAWWLAKNGWGKKAREMLGDRAFDILLAVADGKMLVELAFKAQHLSPFTVHKLVTLHPEMQKHVVEKGLPVVSNGKCETVDISRVTMHQASIAIKEGRIRPQAEQLKVYEKQVNPPPAVAPRKFEILNNGYVRIGAFLFDQRELEYILTQLVNSKGVV